MVKQKQDDQLEHTHSSYVGMRDVALKTCQRWWTIGRCSERGSGISVLAALHDDDDSGGSTEKNCFRCRKLVPHILKLAVMSKTNCSSELWWLFYKVETRDSNHTVVARKKNIHGRVVILKWDFKVQKEESANRKLKIELNNAFPPKITIYKFMYILIIYIYILIYINLFIVQIYIYIYIYILIK